MKFLTDYYNRHNPFNHSRTIGLEMPVKFSLNGFGIKGFIDRLAASGNNIEIHDYKTNSHLPQQEQLERDRQLHLYAMAARKMYPFAKDVELVWYFLAFDKDVRLTADENRLEQVRSNTISLIEKINSEKEFPAKRSALCAWCEFQNHCKGNNIMNGFFNK
jgi:putative RecB family exonuclease